MPPNTDFFFNQYPINSINFMKSNIQLSPIVIKIQKEIKSLQTELTILYEDYENLSTNKKIIIEADYMLKIGVYEIKKLEIEYEARRLKRTLELIQTAINRNEEMNLDNIQAKVEEEYADWVKKLEDMYRNHQNSKTLDVTTLSKEESVKIKELYKGLAFALHPDLNDEQSEKNKNIWMRTQIAYQEGNIQELKILTELLEIKDSHIVHENNLEFLEKKKKQLEQKLEENLDKFAKLKNSFPFNIENKLSDKNWVTMQIRKIKDQITHWKIARKEYNRLINLKIQGKVLEKN